MSAIYNSCSIISQCVRTRYNDTSLSPDRVKERKTSFSPSHSSLLGDEDIMTEN